MVMWLICMLFFVVIVVLSRFLIFVRLVNLLLVGKFLGDGCVKGMCMLSSDVCGLFLVIFVKLWLKLMKV